MPTIQYRDITFKKSSLRMIAQANEIITNYIAQGYRLTLRQLYYQFVDQVDQYKPPPNPAKTTDSRYEGYMAEFGEESWELDALEPSVLAELIRSSVMAVRDNDKWAVKVEEEDEHRRVLGEASSRWDDVVEFLE